jgi:hypothetical protein
MLKKILTCLLTGAAVVLSGAGKAYADKSWDPVGSYDIYIRNNTTSEYRIESINQNSACICD